MKELAQWSEPRWCFPSTPSSSSRSRYGETVAHFFPILEIASLKTHISCFPLTWTRLSYSLMFFGGKNITFSIRLFSKVNVDSKLICVLYMWRYSQSTKLTDILVSCGVCGDILHTDLWVAMCFSRDRLSEQRRGAAITIHSCHVVLFSQTTKKMSKTLNCGICIYSATHWHVLTCTQTTSEQGRLQHTHAGQVSAVTSVSEGKSL